MALSTEIPRSFRLYVTHVDGEGHFLKISGQLDQQASLMIESLFETARENLERGVGAAAPGSIHEGIVCAAKYKDGTYYRAKVINMTNIANGLVGVHFIDFGNKDIISLSTIRFLDNYDPMFLQLRGQATDYYLARVINPSGRWEDTMIMKIQGLLCYSEYSITLDVHTQTLPLISIQFKGNDLSTHLVSIRFGMAIPTAKQEVILLQVSEGQHAPNWQPNFMSDAPAFSEHVPFLLNQNFPANPASAMRLQQHVSLPFNGSIAAAPSAISKRLMNNKVARTSVNVRAPTRQPQLATRAAGVVLSTPPPATTTPPFSAATPSSPKKCITYKSKELEVNSLHSVFISFSDHGPERFAIQLASEADELKHMMDDINKRPYRSLTETPMIGTVCLGRMSRDRVICRAIVMNVTGEKCKLFFVDFGNIEPISYYDIFDIPEEYVSPKAYAVRYCLSGVKKLDRGPHLNEAFKDLAKGNVFTLKTVAAEGPPLIQYGELYLDDRNVLDLLMERMNDKLQFKWPEMLAIGSKHSAMVSYVDSCVKFYIQLSDKIAELNAVMEAVRVHCEAGESPGELAVGASCCARFPDDGKWYRARVRGVRGPLVLVAYVDYGNEQEVAAADLRAITPELVRLPAAAVKCALKVPRYPFAYRCYFFFIIIFILYSDRVTLGMHSKNAVRYEYSVRYSH